MRVGGRLVSRMASNYAGIHAGDLFVIAGSAGFLEVSLNQGNAAKTVSAWSGDTVELLLL
jgi:S-adenosylmethionine hydrolase